MSIDDLIDHLKEAKQKIGGNAPVLFWESAENVFELAFNKGPIENKIGSVRPPIGVRLKTFVVAKEKGQGAFVSFELNRTNL